MLLCCVLCAVVLCSCVCGVVFCGAMLCWCLCCVLLVSVLLVSVPLVVVVIGSDLVGLLFRFFGRQRHYFDAVHCTGCVNCAFRFAFGAFGSRFSGSGFSGSSGVCLSVPSFCFDGG